MIPSRRQRLARGLVLIVAGAPAPAALALDASVSMIYAGEYSSNTALTEEDEIGEWVHTPGADINISQAGARLQMDADYRVERRIYEKDLFENETALRGTAEAILHALPRRLAFTLRNTRSESTIRARQPNTEDNRQTVSSTEAGPTLRLHPRSNAELQLEYLYSDVSVNETDTDSERHTGSARYIVDLSSTRTIAAAATYRDVNFDDPIAPDLETTLGTLTLSNAGRTLQYTLMGGYNRTNRALGRDTVDGAVLSATANWEARSATSFELEASRDIRDRSTDVLSGGGGFGDEIDRDTDLNEIFTESRASLMWNQRIGASRLAVGVSFSEEDYEDVSRDNEQLSYLARFDRALTRRTDLSVSFRQATREFTDQGDEYDETHAAVDITRRLARRLSLSVGGRYEKRDSDGTGSFDYDEWVGRISLTYVVLSPTAT